MGPCCEREPHANSSLVVDFLRARERGLAVELIACQCCTRKRGGIERHQSRRCSQWCGRSLRSRCCNLGDPLSAEGCSCCSAVRPWRWDRFGGAHVCPKTARVDRAALCGGKPGGGGTVGSDWVAKSKADGYTLLAVPISHAANVSQGKLPFDPQKDFSPIIEIASAPNVVLVNPSLGVKDLNAFIALAKENKGQLSYASSGNGSSTHLAGQLMMMSAHIDLLHVPYKGGGPALIDLLGSQVNMYIASIPASIPHLQNQKLVALAVTSSTRTPALPNVPTAMELGLSDFEYLGWYGLLAPKSTPKVVVSKLNALVNQILKEPAVIEKLSQEGATPVGGSSEQFSKFIASEVAKWAKVAQYVKDQPS